MGRLWSKKVRSIGPASAGDVIGLHRLHLSFEWSVHSHETARQQVSTNMTIDLAKGVNEVRSGGRYFDLLGYLKGLRLVGVDARANDVRLIWIIHSSLSMMIIVGHWLDEMGWNAMNR